jgi:predicted GNAT family acetyltransferase
MTTSAVRENPALSRFELEVDGHTAFVNYRRAGDVMLFTHTETPPQLRERGIGSRVVLGALDEVRAQGLKVRPLCSFVRFVIGRHPDYADLVA